jgi:hypothetical protein
MPRVGFEPTITAFERAKTVHALDRTASVIGSLRNYTLFILSITLEINSLSWKNVKTVGTYSNHYAIKG